MKKILYYAAILTAFVSSCSDNDEILSDSPADQNNAVSTITASISQDALTRVAMGPSEGTSTPLTWENGDRIRVSNTDNTSGVYTTTSTSSSGEFTYVSGTNLKSGAHQAFYPESKWESNLAYTQFCFTFKEKQTYTAGTVDKNALPMAAGPTEGTDFSFTAAAPVLRLKLKYYKNTTVTSIKLSATNNLIGSAYYSDSKLDTPIGLGEQKSVTMDCGSGVEIGESATDFCIVIPAGTYEAGTFKIEVTTTDGNKEKLSKADATFAAGKVYNIEMDLTSYAEWSSRLQLGKEEIAESIVVETGVDVSSYTVDATHKSLNSDNTLWEVLDGTTLRIQTSANVIKRTASCESLFARYMNVTSINGLEKIDFDGVTEMTAMFSLCKNLQTLDLSSFNTYALTMTSSMFVYCSNLQQLTLSENFVMTNVDPYYKDNMFAYCSSSYVNSGGRCKIINATAETQAAFRSSKGYQSYFDYVNVP